MGVAPAAEHGRYARLFDALEQVFPVSFQSRTPGDYDGLQGLIFPAADRAETVKAARPGLPCYAVLTGEGAITTGGSARIKFSQSRSLAHVLRGQVLADPANVGFAPLLMSPGEEVMAEKAGQVFWSHRSGSPGQGTVEFASLPLPVLKEDGYLREVFNGKCFANLLPLVHFLQAITRGKSWEAPPLRACFVFDDPNLRRGSYGCINFRELARHACHLNYHAAIGFIPLDALWASSETVALFRENVHSLSLVVHGSRHLRLEMARACPESKRIAILAQGLRRVESFERRYGLPICRVMESPYGVFTADLFKPLLALGYEAATMTPLQFLKCNGTQRFPASLGCESIGCLPGGLGLIPRIIMSPYWKTEVLQAALLGQPIVIVGHHYDAADGLALLEDVATTVNGLGPVHWCRLGDIARTNYMSRVENGTMKILAATRRVRVAIPEGVERIQVERPWLTNGDTESFRLMCLDTGMTLGQTSVRVASPIRVRGVRGIEVLSLSPALINPAQIPPPRPSLWPMVRRILTEARDRAYPYLYEPIARRISHGAPVSSVSS